jgi:hypothetical protein
VHGFGGFRRIGYLAFKTDPASFVEKQEINLSAGVSGPEKGLGARCRAADLLDDETFP